MCGESHTGGRCLPHAPILSYCPLVCLQDDAVRLGEQFSRLQAGLVMLSTYRAQYVVDSMESWRKIRTRELYQRGLELHTIKKSLVAVCSSFSTAYSEVHQLIHGTPAS